MSTVSTEVSKYIGSATKLADIWGNIIVNVKDTAFAGGAKGNGVNDDLAAINAALAAIKAAGGGILYFPPGSYAVSGQIKLRQGNSVNIAVRGSGNWCTVIARKSTYPAGDIFLIDGADGGGCSTLIEHLRIENGTAVLNNTSGSAIHIKNADTVRIQTVYVSNGYTGITVENSNTITIDDVAYFNASAYSALGFTALAGIFFTGGGINHIFISNSFFVGQGAQNASNLQFGMLIRGADGIQVTNSAFSGKVGIQFEGLAAYNIDDIYINNCVIDGVSSVGVIFTGNNTPRVFTNIRICNTHINGVNLASGQDGIQLGGDVDNVQISGCNIGLFMGHGILVGGGNSWRGVAKQNIMINGNIISDNNMANLAGINGVTLQNNTGGVSIVNNKIKNESATGHQQYGIFIGTGCSKLSISDNELYGNPLGGLSISSGLINSLITNNTGVDDQSASVASAAAITLTVHSIISLTGLVTITTINGGWSGRVVRVFANDGSLTLGTGGNILRSVTLAQFQMVTLIMIGNNWVIN